MPFALEWASSHVGSKWSTFDSWTLLGGCFVHHDFFWRIATANVGRRQSGGVWLAEDGE